MAIIKQCDLEFHGVIERGGFGRVQRATWRHSNGSRRQVAVKNLLSPTDETELQMLTKLQHPNIIQLLGYVKEPSATIKGDTDFMLVLEFGSNGSLRSYLERNDTDCPISVNLLFDWMKQATLPIQYLNAKNVQHRDIKSPNYIITQGMLLKLSDFGTAKFVQATRTTSYVGTRRWTAPEYIKDSQLSTRNDIYPLGLVFWEMMTREIPFHRYTDRMEYQLMQAICEKKERPAIPAFCPPDLADLLKRCWEEDRSKRPSLEEILQVIESTREMVVGGAQVNADDAGKTNSKQDAAGRQPQEQDKCYICKASPKDPRTLNCLHEFCLECLREWTEAGNGNTDDQLMCPECRNCTRLTSSGVDDLPDYVHMIEEKLRNVHVTTTQATEQTVNAPDKCDYSESLAKIIGQWYKAKQSKPALEDVISEIELRLNLPFQPSRFEEIGDKVVIQGKGPVHDTPKAIKNPKISKEIWDRGVRQRRYTAGKDEDETVTNQRGDDDPTPRRIVAAESEKKTKEKSPKSNAVTVGSPAVLGSNLRVIETTRAFATSTALQNVIAYIAKLYKDVQIEVLGTHVLIHGTSMLETKVVETMLRNKISDVGNREFPPSTIPPPSRSMDEDVNSSSSENHEYQQRLALYQEYKDQVLRRFKLRQLSVEDRADDRSGADSKPRRMKPRSGARKKQVSPERQLQKSHSEPSHRFSSEDHGIDTQRLDSEHSRKCQDHRGRSKKKAHRSSRRPQKPG